MSIHTITLQVNECLLCIVQELNEKIAYLKDELQETKAETGLMSKQTQKEAAVGLTDHQSNRSRVACSVVNALTI